MMRQFNRREIFTVAALPLLPFDALAEVNYSGQFISMEPAVVNLLGPEAGTTQRFVFKTGNGAPIIRAKQGQPVSIRFINKLSEDVWLHFFGLRAEADAVTVMVPAQQDSIMDVTFTPPDAGTFWFGPLLNVSRLREMGLQGFLIVDPVVADDRYVDVPLLLDDWLVGEDGKIEEDFRNVERAAGEGRLGNWYTVNGEFKPRITLSKVKPSRLRLLNGCNTRVMTLQFKGADAVILARDGQPVSPFAVPNDGLSLAPGQRADVVLAAVSGEQVVLALDLFEDVVETGFLMVDGNLPKLPEPPTLAANVLPVVDLSVAPREVRLVIEGGIKGGLASARVGDQTLDLRAMLEKGLAWAINGVAGPSGVPNFEATVGETLILIIENKTVFDQPLALHGHVWHQLELDGQNTPGQSWRDTAVVPALATARFVMVAERPGVWGLHSLVAERSDAGLFGGFKVLDKP
jgi:FtsP/CotA-like multicopper oxidase with cupredoxin domain